MFSIFLSLSRYWSFSGAWFLRTDRAWLVDVMLILLKRDHPKAFQLFATNFLVINLIVPFLVYKKLNQLWRNLILTTIFGYKKTTWIFYIIPEKKMYFQYFISFALPICFFHPNCFLKNILGQLCDVTHPSRIYLQIWRAIDLIKERWSKRNNQIKYNE